MKGGSKQSAQHPSPSDPRVDKLSPSLAQGHPSLTAQPGSQGWTWTPEILKSCPSQPTEAIMEVAGLSHH